jgi:hypothetical protein
MKTIAGGTTALGVLSVLGNHVITTHTMQSATTSTATLQAGDGASCAIGMIIRIANNTPSGVQFQLRVIIAIATDTVTVDRPWTTTPSSATTYDVWTGALFQTSPNQITTVRRIFYGATAQASGGGTNTWYEKIFVVNDNTATDLTSASITKQIDPVGLYSGGGALDFALTNAPGSSPNQGLNNTDSITTNLNPGTPPTNITAYSSGAAPQSINEPNTNAYLPHGTAPNAAGAQAVWLRLTLVAGEATVNSFVDMRSAGSTI